MGIAFSGIPPVVPSPVGRNNIVSVAINVLRRLSHSLNVAAYTLYTHTF